MDTTSFSLKWNKTKTDPETWTALSPKGYSLLTWRLKNGRWVCEYGDEVFKVADNLLNAKSELEEIESWERTALGAG